MPQLDDALARYLTNVANRIHTQYSLPKGTRADCVQIAMLKVMRFAKRYKGKAPFEAVAAKRIRWDILDFVKKHQRMSKQNALILPVGDKFIKRLIDPRRQVEHRIEAADFIKELCRRLSKSKTRRLVLLLAAGFLQHEAAKILGVHESRVSQIMQREVIPVALKLNRVATSLEILRANRQKEEEGQNSTQEEEASV